MQVVEMKVMLCALHADDLAAVGLATRWATDGDFDYVAKKGSKGSVSLLARALLRALLHRLTGSGDWTMAADDNGKPYLRDERGALGPAISLSHGGGMVAAAVGPPGLRIGVDVEPHKARDVMALAAKAFGPAEKQQVAEGGAAAFYKLWTLREAMGKATGQGLSLAADGVDHVGKSQGDGVWRVPGWVFGYWPDPGYSLAAAVERPGNAAVDIDLLPLGEICR
jgi:phosphopantetheinyl transferase